MSTALTAFTAVVGTLTEKRDTFAQIATTSTSGMLPAGYDTVPKVLAACWGADALAIHPFIFMQGMQPLEFRGRRVLEPTRHFINGLLRSRLPGFDFEWIQRTGQACEIKMWADGIAPKVEKYEMKDAVRQGLAGPNGRNADTYAKNDREMLEKQCFKRCAWEVGAHVLMGMPAGVAGDAIEADGQEPERLEGPVATNTTEAVTAGVTAPAPAAQPSDLDAVLTGAPDWRAQMPPMIRRTFGFPDGRGSASKVQAKMRALLIELAVQHDKVSREVAEASYPENLRPTAVSQEQAHRLVAFLSNQGAQLFGSRAEVMEDESGTGTSTSPPADKDAGPAPPITADAPPPPAVDLSSADPWESFCYRLSQMVKTLGDPARPIVRENGGAWYLTDMPIFQKLGQAAPMLLYFKGLQVEPSLLETILREVQEVVNSKGGRQGAA